MTLIGEFLGWPEIIRVRGEGSDTSLECSQILDREWFCRYPRPQKVIHDYGPEFNGEELQEMLESYGLKHHPITLHNLKDDII